MMEKSFEVIHIKKEPSELAAHDERKIPTEIQESGLELSKIYIKTESQEYDREFPVSPAMTKKADTSYGMCDNYDVKIEADEPMVEVEYDDIEDDIMQDPLDVHSSLKDASDNNLLSDVGMRNMEAEDDEKYILTNDEGLNSPENVESNNKKQELEPDKKHACHICPKSYALKGNLDKHLRLHTGERPFTCEHCKKSFNRRVHLNDHMLIHSNERPHACDICNKCFRQKSGLKTHKLIHSDEKIFSCNDCNKSFTRKDHLVSHMRVHADDKICDLCDVTNGEHIHTGRVRFSCDLCNKSYASKSGLNRHNNKNHKN